MVTNKDDMMITHRITIKDGQSAPEGFIEDVFALDEEGYDTDLCGDISQLKKRTEFLKDSFVLMYVEDRLIGYINFFPVSESLFKELTDKNNNVMRDDDIEPHEMKHWSTDENNVFIISLVIKKEFRNSNAIVVLGNEFLNYLRDKNSSGYTITSLSGSAVSNGGANFLKRFGAHFDRFLEHDYRFYITQEDELQVLLKSNSKLQKDI